MALRLVRCMCFFVVIVFVVVPWFLWLSDSLLGSRGFSGFLVLTRTVPWLSGFNFVVLWSFWFSWFVIPFSYSLLVSCFSSSLFLLVLWMSCFSGCCVLVPPPGSGSLVLVRGSLILVFRWLSWFMWLFGCRNSLVVMGSGCRGPLVLVVPWLSWLSGSLKCVVNALFYQYKNHHSPSSLPCKPP